MERPRSGPALLAIPLAMMAVIATVDILSPSDIHLGPLLVVAPAITASFAGPRPTACVGALAVTVLVVIGLARGVITTANLQVQIVSLIAISAFIVAFDYLREHSRRELVQVRTVSDAAQRVLLRPLPPHLGPLTVASSYRAAHTGAHIGGDLYAAARTRSSTRLIIGDVRGKGLGTLGDTAQLLGAFRAAAHRQAPLTDLVAYLEGSVAWGLAEPGAQEDQDPAAPPPTEIGEGFVTALIIDIPDQQAQLTMINCGHPSPLLLRHGRAVALDVPQPAPPLGLGTLTSAAHPYTPTCFPFQAGDLLLLYTDGVSEARDSGGEFYPLPARLGHLHQLGLHTPDALLTALNADLDTHVGAPLADDAAMLAVTRRPSPPTTAG
ncbi:PP2C family protein-serine/threonine phosphatase [Streptacidiphilus sp. N1-12]|uniref:PP2C family protein-serine/threonine phosphatase n=2 Tax=Streptacidiphilus alkalitolerans TaxID=3342712 RepID=A0ABV6WMG6_9ACTN